jgi:hypothetical protein
MRAWNWFCQLGIDKNESSHSKKYLLKNSIGVNRNANVDDGTEEFCTRLNGRGICQCGSNFRGLHCIWSHYRRT